MAESFIWRALFISLTLHTTVVCVSYFWRMNDPRDQAMRYNGVEVSYRVNHKRAEDIQGYRMKAAQLLDLNSGTKPMAPGGAELINLVKERQMLPSQMMVERKPERARGLQLSRRVSITPIKSVKINNPAYAAYNEMVRSRIEEKVYQNYDRIGIGTVYLTFAVQADGVLRATQIIQEKSSASRHLQEISLNSLKQSGPFPAFLKGMTLPEYTFNIEVQYQVPN